MDCPSPVSPKNHPVASHLVPQDPDRMSQCIRPVIRPIYTLFLPSVKHVCVPASAAENEVDVHSPPSRMFVGTGVLSPGILPYLYGLAALPRHGHNTSGSWNPQDNVTEVSGVQDMQHPPVGAKNHPVASHLVRRTRICLAQCIRPIISPILHCFYRRVKHVCVFRSLDP